MPETSAPLVRAHYPLGKLTYFLIIHGWSPSVQLDIISNTASIQTLSIERSLTSLAL
jgi:hypothetical protein